MPLSRLSTIAFLLVLGCSDSSQNSAGASGGSAGAVGQGGSGQGGSGQGGTGGENQGGSSQGGSTAGGAAGSGGVEMACNGRPELCDRAFNDVAYPSTHNSMSNGDAGWIVPNQRHGMTKQLEDGIRGMLIDTHDWMGDLYLCHSICEIGSQLLVEGLGEIKAFMDANPNEVITLIIQDGISASETETAFQQSGLIEYVHVHPDGVPWPTLRTMIETGERLVVTAEREGPPPAWYHHVWDLSWDTPYSFSSASEFSCSENRGSSTHDLFLLNHWIENPLATEDLSIIANEKQLLLGRARQCMQEAGQIPNFVAVNHYSIGALFEVVDELNGFTP